MVVVTGATGNVGREVVNLLLAAGEKVTAVTRNPSRPCCRAVPTWCAATRPAR
jgi:nucleoside-diphosphate-sugar epimerase